MNIAQVEFTIETAISRLPIRNQSSALTWLQRLYVDALRMGQYGIENVEVANINGWPILSDELIELFAEDGDSITAASARFLTQLYLHGAFARVSDADEQLLDNILLNYAYQELHEFKTAELNA